MTKPATVFLGEMTNLEVEAFLAKHHTVIIPVGATEQHGPHGPLATDVLIPVEVARRVAPQIGAVVAPPLSYALSYPHVGFTGMVHIRIPTFMALIEDLCASFAHIGFKRLVFLNGHYDNTYAIAYACANAAERLPKDVQAFPVNYWDAFTESDIAEFSGLKNGLHANLGETSAVMAINPDLVDLEKANAEFPPFPEFTVPTGPVHSAFFFTNPGSVHWATKSGTWGDARKSNPERRRALPRGGRAVDARVAREHRANFRGDASQIEPTSVSLLPAIPFRRRSTISSRSSDPRGFTNPPELLRPKAAADGVYASARMVRAHRATVSPAWFG